MAATVKLEGLDTVLKNLNTEIKKVRGATRKGLIKSVIKVAADSMRITPIDTSNLVHSLYTVVSGGGEQAYEKSNPEFKAESSTTKRKANVGRLQAEHRQDVNEAMTDGSDLVPIGTIGYSAYYAAYVHEMQGATYQRPSAQPKFLETAFKQNYKTILDIIQREAQIRK